AAAYSDRRRPQLRPKLRFQSLQRRQFRSSAAAYAVDPDRDLDPRPPRKSFSKAFIPQKGASGVPLSTRFASRSSTGSSLTTLAKVSGEIFRPSSTFETPNSPLHVSL